MNNGSHVHIHPLAAEFVDAISSIYHQNRITSATIAFDRVDNKHITCINFEFDVSSSPFANPRATLFVIIAASTHELIGCHTMIVEPFMKALEGCTSDDYVGSLYAHIVHKTSSDIPPPTTTISTSPLVLVSADTSNLLASDATLQAPIPIGCPAVVQQPESHPLFEGSPQFGAKSAPHATGSTTLKPRHTSDHRQQQSSPRSDLQMSGGGTNKVSSAIVDDDNISISSVHSTTSKANAVMRYAPAAIRRSSGGVGSHAHPRSSSSSNNLLVEFMEEAETLLNNDQIDKNTKTLRVAVILFPDAVRQIMLT